MNSWPLLDKCWQRQTGNEGREWRNNTQQRFLAVMYVVVIWHSAIKMPPTGNILLVIFLDRLIASVLYTSIGEHKRAVESENSRLALRLKKTKTGEDSRLYLLLHVQHQLFIYWTRLIQSSHQNTWKKPGWKQLSHEKLTEKKRHQHVPQNNASLCSSDKVLRPWWSWQQQRRKMGDIFKETNSA